MKKNTLTPFEQALLNVNLEEFEDIPAESEINLDLSPQFQAKADELIRRMHRQSNKRTMPLLRKVALVALIAAILALTACAVPAVREAIINFFFRDEGTHYEFTYDPEQAATAPDKIEEVYIPINIPNGFELVVNDISSSGVVLMWCNAEDVWINYIQGVIPDDPSLGDGGGFNSEGAVTEWITLGNCQVLRIEDDEWIHYAWTSSEYEFSLSCSDKSMEDELKEAYYSIHIDTDMLLVQP